VVVVCLFLLIAPFAVLGWILYSSSQDSGSPVLGNRYEGDLNPAITTENMEQVKSAVAALPGVESAEVTMPTATLRVYADIADDADSVAAYETAIQMYDAVTAILNPDVYFSQHDDMKMYDLELHVTNHPEEDNPDNYVYVVAVKNSSMSGLRGQLLSEAVNAGLAESLRQDVLDREAAEAAEAASTASPEGGEVEITSEELPAGEEGTESTEEQSSTEGQ